MLGLTLCRHDWFLLRCSMGIMMDKIAFTKKNSKYTIVLVVIVLLCSLLIFFKKPLLAYSYRMSYRRAASAFWDSMRVNDIDTAKIITDSTQWDRIDEWMGTRHIEDCDFSQTPYGPQRSLRQIDRDLWEISLSHFCESTNHRTYSFSIEDVKVQKRNSGWIIIDWQDISWKQIN